MRKTGSEIENDVLQVVNDSALKTAISGSVYLGGTRPVNSLTEDIVVSLISGNDDVIQSGVVEVNIYVLDVSDTKGGFIKNTSRCLELEQKTMTFFNTMASTEYSFSLGDIIKSMKVSDVNQHYVNMKLKFKRSIN